MNICTIVFVIMYSSGSRELCVSYMACCFVVSGLFLFYLNYSVVVVGFYLFLYTSNAQVDELCVCFLCDIYVPVTSKFQVVLILLIHLVFLCTN